MKLYSCYHKKEVELLKLFSIFALVITASCHPLKGGQAVHVSVIRLLLKES